MVPGGEYPDSLPTAGDILEPPPSREDPLTPQTGKVFEHLPSRGDLWNPENGIQKKSPNSLHPTGDAVEATPAQARRSHGGEEVSVVSVDKASSVTSQGAREDSAET